MTPASPYRSPHTSLRQDCRLRWAVAPRTAPVSLWSRGPAPKPRNAPQAACGSHRELNRTRPAEPTCSPAPHAVGAHGCMSFDGRGELFFSAELLALIVEASRSVGSAMRRKAPFSTARSVGNDPGRSGHLRRTLRTLRPSAEASKHLPLHPRPPRNLPPELGRRDRVELTSRSRVQQEVLGCSRTCAQRAQRAPEISRTPGIVRNR